MKKKSKTVDLSFRRDYKLEVSLEIKVSNRRKKPSSVKHAQRVQLHQVHSPKIQ